MKSCTKCGAEKALTEFYIRRNRRGGSATVAACKECTKASARLANARYAARADVDLPETHACSWCRQELPASAFARNRSKSRGIQNICYACHRARRYGLEIGQYERLLAEQNGVCAICGQTCSRGLLSVDHDHDTGAVRGLLCSACNAGLGMYQDDPDRLLAAATYILRGANVLGMVE